MFQPIKEKLHKKGRSVSNPPGPARDLDEISVAESVPVDTGVWADMFSALGDFEPTAPPSRPESDPEILVPSYWYRLTCSVTPSSDRQIPDHVMLIGLWKTLYRRLTSPGLKATAAILILALRKETGARGPQPCNVHQYFSCLSIAQNNPPLTPGHPFQVNGQMSTLVEGKVLEGAFTLLIEVSSGSLGNSTFSCLIDRGHVDTANRESKLGWRETTVLQILVGAPTMMYLKKLKMI